MIPVARPVVGRLERRAVNRVLKSRNLAQGIEVQKFEVEFGSNLLGGEGVVAVNSGTSGLHLGLLAMGVGNGDEVIVPSFTFAATANSVVLAGAKPVFCDIDPGTFTLNPAHLETLISTRTRGVMPVHLFGHPASMTEIMEIANRRGIEVYEDAAQAHGSSLNGKMVGTWGDFAMFSLYPTKNMTSGEGGMVACRSEVVERNMRLLRNQGMEKQYHNEIVGFNNRMSDIHAALGRVQLGRLERWTAKRRDNAKYLGKHIRGVTVPLEMPGAVHVYHQFTIRVPEDRDGFAIALTREFGIGNGIYYPVPSHRLMSLKKYARGVDLPETEEASLEVLSLPVHPSLSRRNLDRIVNAVNHLASAGA